MLKSPFQGFGGGAIQQTPPLAKYSWAGNFVVLTTLLPYDSTAPLFTEGDSVFNFNYRPTRADSWLRITANILAGSFTGQQISVAAWKDSSQLLGVSSAYCTSGNSIVIPFLGYVPAYSTTSQNLNIRVGGHSGAVYWNGTGTASPLFGGYNGSMVTIEELLDYVP